MKENLMIFLKSNTFDKSRKYFEIRFMIRFNMNFTCSFFKIFLIITTIFNDFKIRLYDFDNDFDLIDDNEKHFTFCFFFWNQSIHKRKSFRSWLCLLNRLNFDRKVWKVWKISIVVFWFFIFDFVVISIHAFCNRKRRLS